MRTLLAQAHPLPLRRLGPAHRVTRRRPEAAFAVVAAISALVAGPGAFGQVPVTLNGPPVQVQPYVSEPGVPMITINPGTPNPFPGGDGSGSGTGTGDTGGGTGDGTGGGSVGGSEPLYTMMGTTWGIQAITAVQSLGVNPSAIAATCVLESGCQNVGGSGAAQGAFQMFPAAFNEGLRTALAANPALALQIVPGDAGRMDPVTEAIAAAGYQMQAVQSLQSANIGDPTVLDTRSYYEFGPQFAAPVATAADSQSLAALVPASFLTKNNIPMGTTVGQWRASVATKIGNAAGQSVLS